MLLGHHLPEEEISLASGKGSWRSDRTLGRPSLIPVEEIVDKRCCDGELERCDQPPEHARNRRQIKLELIRNRDPAAVGAVQVGLLQAPFPARDNVGDYRRRKARRLYSDMVLAEFSRELLHPLRTRVARSPAHSSAVDRSLASNGRS